MRRTKELQWRRVLSACVTAMIMAMMLAVFSKAFSIVSHAESEAQVTAASANIRKEPNPSSETIGSTQKDKVISIKSQVQGTDGYTWYEVFVDANTLGYIRSDLVKITDGTTPPTGTTATATDPATSAPDEPLVDVAQVNPVSASVTGSDSVRVRQNASTTSRIVATAQNGMELTIVGTATGKDNKIWYQVSYTANGTEVTGFIRSDYTTVTPEELTAYTEAPPEAEQPPVDEPPVTDPEPVVTQAYGLVLQEGAWMLVDYEGKHGPAEHGYAVASLFDGVTQNKALFEDSEKTVKSQKIVIILLVILLVCAAAAITLLIFKVKDMTDAQYFNDVENETLRRRGTRPQGSGQRVMQTVGDRQGGRTGGARSAGAAQGQRPQGSRPAGAVQSQRPQGSRPAGAVQGQRPQNGRPAAAVQGARPAGMGAAQGQPSQAAQSQQRPAAQGQRPSGAAQSQQRPGAQGQRPQGGRPAQSQQNPGWQSKNFMADDDEFEFEFLNYEEDDQK